MTLVKNHRKIFVALCALVAVMIAAGTVLLYVAQIETVYAVKAGGVEIFKVKDKKSKGFIITLALLPIVVQVVIMLVNGNVGTGVAVMGAFGLVRFRSAPGKAEDICAIFLAMAVGLATGTDQLAIAAALAIGVSLIYLVLEFIPFGGGNKHSRQLSVTIPESLDYDGAFDDIFDNYTAYHELISVRTTNMGSLFKLKYEVIFNSTSDEKKLIDEIRTRNGNLEIICSRLSDEMVQSL